MCFHLPIPVYDDLVRLRPALFAVVLFGEHRLVRQAHAASMLPHLTIVALHEEVAQVIGQGFYGRDISMDIPAPLGSVLLTISLQSLSDPRRRTRVLWLPTYTSCNLLFWFSLFFLMFFCLRLDFFLDFGTSPAATRCLWL